MATKQTPGPYLYAGDVNAYTAEELEDHVTPHELRTLLHCSGDVNPAHSPAPPLTSATVPAADYTGRLLLIMINSLEFIITDGRFPVPPPTLRPYTFFRKPNTHSVLDYNLIATLKTSCPPHPEVRSTPRFSPRLCDRSYAYPPSP